MTRESQSGAGRSERGTRRSRVIIEGRVQGVWFRESVREHALASGVAGWVKNRTDGAVEAVFEGDRDEVDRCVRYCEIGPPRAMVSNVQVFDEEPAGSAAGTKSFEVISE